MRVAEPPLRAREVLQARIPTAVKVPSPSFLSSILPNDINNHSNRKDNKVSLFRDGSLQRGSSQNEIVRVGLIQHDWCPYRNGKFAHTETHTQRRLREESQGEDATCKPRTVAWNRYFPRPSEGTSPADTVILAFRPPDRVRQEECVF